MPSYFLQQALRTYVMLSKKLLHFVYAFLQAFYQSQTQRLVALLEFFDAKMRKR